MAGISCHGLEALLALSWRFAVVRWLVAGLGLWVMFAPLVFWAPTAQGLSQRYAGGRAYLRLCRGGATGSGDQPGGRLDGTDGAAGLGLFAV